MQWAIQETLLPGRTAVERFQAAKTWGFDGVEISVQGLYEARLMDVAQAIDASGVRVAALTMGTQAGYLSPEMAEREAAIGRLRQAMASAVDLLAADVIFAPHYGPPQVPDFRPYRSPGEIERELFIWLLRTVSDLAYALGPTLHMQPRHRYDTHFLNTLEQAVAYREEIKNHPHVKVAVDTFHLAMEEEDAIGTLERQAEHIGYVTLCDSNGRLPGQGLLDFAAIGGVLKKANYAGWITLGADAAFRQPEQMRSAMPGCLETLSASGLR